MKLPLLALLAAVSLGGCATIEAPIWGWTLTKNETVGEPGGRYVKRFRAEGPDLQTADAIAEGALHRWAQYKCPNGHRVEQKLWPQHNGASCSMAGNCIVFSTEELRIQRV